MSDEAKKVWVFEDGGRHWVIARNAEEAKKEFISSFLDGNDFEYEGYIPTELPPDRELTMSDCGCEPFIKKTCAEWAETHDVGPLMTTEF